MQYKTQYGVDTENGWSRNEVWSDYDENEKRFAEFDYVFDDGKLSKIAYILMDNSNQAVVKECAKNLVNAMSNTLGTESAAGKNVNECGYFRILFIII